MKLQHMLPYQLREAVQKKYPVFIAFGATEYHSEHLPLGTDTLIAQGIIDEIEKALPIVSAPPITVAPTMHWAGKASDGDVDFPGKVLLDYVRAYLAGLLECGFSKIYVLLGHQGLDGDPGTIVKRAYWDLTEQTAASFGQGWGQHPEQTAGAENIFSKVEPVVYDQFCDYAGLRERLPVGHAGRGETQLIQALYPDLPDLSRLADVPQPWPDWLKDVVRADPANGRFWIDFCVAGWIRHLTTA